MTRPPCCLSLSAPPKICRLQTSAIPTSLIVGYAKLSTRWRGQARVGRGCGAHKKITLKARRSGAWTCLLSRTRPAPEPIPRQPAPRIASTALKTRPDEAATRRARARAGSTAGTTATMDEAAAGRARALTVTTVGMTAQADEAVARRARALTVTTVGMTAQADEAVARRVRARYPATTAKTTPGLDRLTARSDRLQIGPVFAGVDRSGFRRIGPIRA
jgi:hypothetical protein